MLCSKNNQTNHPTVQETYQYFNR